MVLPADKPKTVPEEIPIVATVVSLLVHVPPVMASLKEVVEPGQTVVVPVIGSGPKGAVTVTSLVAYAVPQLLETA